MYAAHFNELHKRLLSASDEDLTTYATSGGWRKVLIDQGRGSPDSWSDLLQMIRRCVSFFVRLLPPIGRDFRRALVAQEIIDSKTSVW